MSSNKKERLFSICDKFWSNSWKENVSRTEQLRQEERRLFGRNRTSREQQHIKIETNAKKEAKPLLYRRVLEYYTPQQIDTVVNDYNNNMTIKEVAFKNNVRYKVMRVFLIKHVKNYHIKAADNRKMNGCKTQHIAE